MSTASKKLKSENKSSTGDHVVTTSRSNDDKVDDEELTR